MHSNTLELLKDFVIEKCKSSIDLGKHRTEIETKKESLTDY